MATSHTRDEGVRLAGSSTDGGLAREPRAELARIAQLVLEATGAVDCFVLFRDGIRTQRVRAASAATRLAPLENALLSLIERDGFDRGFASWEPAVLAIGAGANQFPLLRPRALAIREERGNVSVMIAALVGANAAVEGSRAVLALAAECAIDRLLEPERAGVRALWRERAERSVRQARSMRAMASARDHDLATIENAARKIERFRSRDWLAGVGQVLAGIGPFDGWRVEVRHGAKLVQRAALPPQFTSDSAEGPSASAESLARRCVVERAGLRERPAIYAEDVALRALGFGSYLCIPFGDGVITLATVGETAAPARARAQALMRHVGPSLRCRLLEEQLSESRGVVRRLATRLFSAADLERARIARELHDDNAQLLAAARIALRSPGARAAALLKQVEERMRARVRALRPATLGRASLAQGIAAELERLSAAGLRTSFQSHDARCAIPRPLQQLCYQAAREAVSNIANHAHASRVDVTLSADSSLVRLEVSDNGRGLKPPGDRDSLGIVGISERVAMMGGKCSLESKRGRTCLTIEIPRV